MQKLLIITEFNYDNYGQKLQNYAVQELVRQEGLEPFTYVEIKADRGWRPDWKLLVSYLAAPLGKRRGPRLMHRRVSRFRKFVDERMTTVELRPEQLIRSGDDFDVFLAGSDQVWNSLHRGKLELERNFLRFAPRRKRICFAPSFGFDEDPDALREEYVEGLLGFDMLSCRERSGCEIIRRLTGREAELLCDPTMMLSVAQWNAFSRPPRSALPERFLATYFLSPMPRAVKERIRQFARERNLAIVMLRHIDQPQYFDATPDEFIYILQRAEHVFTDSFHGCVFSILYHRSFTVFERNEQAYSKMFGRIETLLKMFGLEACANPDRMDAPLDYSGADAIIAEERGKGVRYLHAALERALAKGESAPS